RTWRGVTNCGRRDDGWMRAGLRARVCRSSRGKAPCRARGLGERARHRRWGATILEHMPETDRDSGSPGGVALHRGGGGVTDARIAAAEICADLRSGELLDPAFDRRTARLDARDRRWVRELVYGMLRRRARLDAYLDARIRGGMARLDADLLDLLRL